ncbi:MAG: NAD(P)-dependent oxidoreductase [Proteobacteria bacterium]|nr:NAD(P)-dependent oxidoreductase [Pseudomonadota bacterium]
MKILITGAAGILGKTLTELFSEKYSVLSCDRNTLDITSRVQVRKITQQFCPDILIHTAAFTNVEKAEESPEDAFAINIYGTLNLLESIQMSNCLFIYISSTGIYGFAKEKMPYTEFDAVVPTTQYHRSKYEGELLIQRHAHRFLILRTGWLFGGDIHQRKNFVYRRYLEAKSKTILFADPIQRGNPTYVLDLSRQIEHLILNEVIGTYNCVSAEPVTRLEYIQEIISNLGLNCEVRSIEGNKFPRIAPVSSNESALNYGLDMRGLNIMPNWKSSLKMYINTLAL